MLRCAIRPAAESLVLSAVLLVGCRSAPTMLPALVQPGAPGQPARDVSVDDSTNLGGIRHTQADLRFMQDMMRHHAQALEMAALVPARTEREEMRLLAQRIDVSQADEIKTIRQWLEERNLPGSADHATHGAAEAMPGMLTDAEMALLREARGRDFDRLFLRLMIKHHEGAIAMVNDLFEQPGAGQESNVFVFATDVLADQQMEIARMTRMIDAP
jgi:uncharacterized protein (DUF305 family)